MEENVLAKPHPSATPPSAFADRPSYKWWVTWTMMVGSFLFALDTTIVNIAIPKIMTSISADLNQIQWVLIIYMIGMAVVTPNDHHRSTHAHKSPDKVPDVKPCFPILPMVLHCNTRCLCLLCPLHS